MSDSVIKIANLGKKYRIRHKRRERYTTLRDTISEKVRNLFRTNAPEDGQLPSVEDFWALRDVSFEVGRGEVIGIIGRNGAGKSTLLKILSRITEPSEGRVEIEGRVASLLEVGTGFHPELTGRENIYLNGAVMGMTRADIRRRFDEIVAFAEVEQFLDTPVKRFSSGMYVRLAFAVAAHLEPDILIVDEVLAVGDAEFQRKCLGTMDEIASRQGRTVLFVSHNMGSIRRLTERCILLDKGRLLLDVPVQEAIDHYLRQIADGVAGGIFQRKDPPAAGQPFYVQRVTTRSERYGEPSGHFDCDDSFVICMDYLATRRVSGLYGYMTFSRSDGTIVFEGDSFDGGNNRLDRLVAGQGTMTVRVPPRILGPGTYQIYINFAALSDPAGPNIDSPGIVGEFTMEDSRTRRGNHRNGYLSVILDWETETPAIPSTAAVHS
jgi:lipopolysaccharide transport system ATP-binding protein